MEQPSQQDVLQVLGQIMDPELGRSLPELGLIQAIDIDDGVVHIDLQLTTPACPYSERFVHTIKTRVGALVGVQEVEVDLVCSDG